MSYQSKDTEFSAHAKTRIAASLCAILLKSLRAEDATLLESIMSTPLHSLKKRGFNVDRILNKHHEERLRLKAEAARDREKAAADAQAIMQKPTPPPPSAPDAPNGDAQSIRSVQSSSSSLSKSKSLLNKFKRSSKDSLPQMPGGMPGGLPSPPSANGGFAQGPGRGSTQTTKRPTDLQSIRNTVEKAINASRPEVGTQISDSRQSVRDVSESQDDYCDTSAEADIVLAFDPGLQDIKIWVPRDVTDPQAFMHDKFATCQRFSHEILKPIGKVFKLAPGVLNIFWDHEGPLIAFNKAGSIFCNARYFTSWHDAACQLGMRNEAFISWYFSIAHELAHNLESAHNSSHEFYFSSIAEEYLVRFTHLLQGQ